MDKANQDKVKHTYIRIFSEIEVLKYNRHDQEHNTNDNTQRLRPVINKKKTHTLISRIHIERKKLSIKDSHFNLSLRRASLIDIETEHVTPQNVSSSYGDHLERDEETHQAKRGVDEDGAFQLGVDGVVGTEEVEVERAEES